MTGLSRLIYQIDLVDCKLHRIVWRTRLLRSIYFNRLLPNRRSFMKAFVSAVFQAVNRVLEPIGLRLMRTNAPVRNFALFFKHLKSLGLRGEAP